MRCSTKSRTSIARAASAAVVALCAFDFALPAASAAADPVEVEAGSISYTQDGSVLKASDDVRIRWQGNVLTADGVVVEQERGRLVSEGDIVLETPDLTLRAGRCEIYFEDETGELENVRVSFKDRPGGFGGDRIQKHAGRRYSLEDGYYTTCDTSEGKAPEWELAGEKVDLELDGYGKLRGGTFRIKGVPVLYVPYAVFPTNERRQSGFLLPDTGLSDDRGFIFRQPFFWAISKHRDLTLSGDLESAARVGLDTEYRYEPSKDISGRLHVQYYNEEIRGNRKTEVEVSSDKQAALDAYDIPRDRASLRLRHRQHLGRRARLYGDMSMVTDELYLREIDSADRYYDDALVRRTQRYTSNRFGVVVEDGHASWGARSLTYQDIDITNPDVTTLTRQDSLTLQRPIEIWGDLDGEKLGFNYGLRGTLTSFLRRKGDDGERFDATATLGRHLTGNHPIRSNAWVSGRMTAYHMEETAVLDDSGVFVEELDKTAARGVVEAGIDVSTALARDFRLDARERVDEATGELSSSAIVVDHVLEPFARLRYTSGSNEDDIPLYDGVDRIDGRTTATYGLLSRIHLRDEALRGQSEAARFSISQSYNLDEEVIDDHFSDIDFLAAFRPIRGFSVTGLASYNVGASKLSGATSAVSARGFKLPYAAASESRIEAVYRFVRAEAVSGDPTVDDLESIEGRIILGLTNRLSVGFNGRYDVATNSTVEQGGGIRIESACDCWAIELGVSSRVNPDETQLRLRIELSGLGNLGPSPLEFESPGLAGLERGETGYWRSGW